MSDYDYCSKHDTSFLMPELLMCPNCALEALKRGEVRDMLSECLPYITGGPDSDYLKSKRLS